MSIIPAIRFVVTNVASAGAGVVVGRACDAALPDESEGKLMQTLGIIGKVAIVITTGAIVATYVSGIFPTDSDDSDEE